MTTTFCGSCGTALSAGVRFCGVCGTPAAAPAPPFAQTGPVEQAPNNGHSAGGYAQPAAPPVYGQAAPSPQSHPQGGPPPYAGQPGAGSAPLPGVPWAGQRQPGTGRDGVDAFLGGDWAGAALAAGAAVASMLIIALAALLLADASQAGAHVVLSATLMLVCAGFGGDLFARASGSGFGSSGDGNASGGALPLTLTLVGCTVLAVLYLRRTRRTNTRDALFQLARTTLVLAVLAFILALVSRLHSTIDAGLFGLDGTVGASIPSSVIGAILFSIATLGIALFLARPGVLHPRLRQLREGTKPALVGCVAVTAVALVGALGGLVYFLSTEPERLAQIAGALLALPNVALGGLLLAMGVPLSGHGSASGLGQDLGSSGDSITLLTLTERSPWWWAAPVALALTLVAVAVALVVRQHTLPSARREALRFAGCFALIAFVAALLLRAAANGGGGFLDSNVNGKASIEFNPLLAAIVAGLWGLAAAVIAPQVAAAAGGGVVHAVRGRFGTAPPPAAQPYAPPAAQGQPYAWQPYAEPAPGPQYGGAQYPQPWPSGPGYDGQQYDRQQYDRQPSDPSQQQGPYAGPTS